MIRGNSKKNDKIEVRASINRKKAEIEGRSKEAAAIRNRVLKMK